MEFEWMKQYGNMDDPGEKPIPEIGKIFGVSVRKLDVFEDDRGFLSEVCRTDWSEVYGVIGLDHFQQVYIIGNYQVGTVRAFHKHNELVDFFIVVSGAAKFVLFDDHPRSDTYGNMQTVIASANNMKMIVVPRFVYHGWQSLQENTLLLSVANNLYMGIDKKEELDEHRIPYDSFGKKIWEVEYK